MTIDKLLELIQMPKEVTLLLDDINIDTDVVDRIYTKLTTPDVWYEALKELAGSLAPDIGGLKMLKCQLYAATISYERYMKLGISEHIFVETMKCFTRFVVESNAMYGDWRFDREWWSVRQLALMLFRVGTLEFETLKHGKGTYISVHIPSDAVLTSEVCDESFRAGRQFMVKYFPSFGNRPFVCESWMLSPALNKLLPKTSNLIKFKSRFIILKKLPKEDSFLRFVFKTDSKDYTTLPENTRLQRAMKKHLLSGHKVGAALGVMPRKYKK